MRVRTLSVVVGAAAVLLPMVAQAQWAKEIGAGSRNDAYSVVATSDGGYVLSGLTEPDQDGDADFWVVKLDADGEMEWQKSYGGACPCEWAWSIQQTSDGGYIVAGYTCTCARSFDIWVLKLDSAGDVVWQNAYGGEGADTSYVVREARDADGNPDGYIVGGRTDSFGDEDGDVILIRLNPDGSVAWQKTYGWHNKEYVGSVEPTSDGGFIVAARTASFGRSADAWVLKLDARGEIEWQVAYGGEGGEGASAIRETRDGSGQADGYIVAGDSSSFSSDADGDAWVLRLALDGTILWQKIYSGTWSGASDGIEQTFDANGVPSGYVVSGSLVAIDGGVNSNGWLLRLEPDGALRWMSHYGGCADEGMSAFERLRGITQASDGGFTAVGYSQIAMAPGHRTVLVVHVNEDGELPYCGKLSHESEMTVADTDAAGLMTNLTPETPPLTWQATGYEGQETFGTTSTVCSGHLTIAPRPDVTVAPTQPLTPIGGLVRLDGWTVVAQEIDGDSIADYAWDLDGDGWFDDAVGPVVTHSWTALGVHEVRLRVALPSGKVVVKSMRVPITGVAIDAVPGSCANVWNARGDGVLSMAIRGSKIFDVHEIDARSVTLMGAPAVKWSYDDAAVVPKEGGCVEDARDGITDLVLDFESTAVASAVESLTRRPLTEGEVLALRLTGRLTSGATFHGEDSVIVTAKAPAGRLEDLSARSWILNPRYR